MSFRTAVFSAAAFLAGVALAQNTSGPTSGQPTTRSGSAPPTGAASSTTPTAGGGTTAGRTTTATSGSGSGARGAPALAVVGLTVSPTSLQVGQDGTITVSVRNVGSAPATFMTTLSWDGPSLGPVDERADLPAGQTHTFSRTWRAVAGRHLFVAKADPDNKLREPDASRADNTRSLVVEAAQRLVDRTIAYRVAEGAGAQFPAPSVSGGSCNARTWPAENGGVAVELRCPSLGGGSATHRAYVGFRLRNGWKVKSTNVEVTENHGGGFDVVKPATGGDNPETTVHLRSGPFGAIRLVLTTVVTGPDGTGYDR